MEEFLEKLSSKNLQFVESLGKGKFGEVYRARVLRSATVHDAQQQQVEVEVACKVLMKLGSVEGGGEVEARIMRRLAKGASEATPIVRLRGVETAGPLCCLTMELCKGGTLLDTLRARPSCTLTEAEAAIVVERMVRALIHCHNRGVVHRDVKPENILLSHKGDLWSAKLGDFGLSAVLHFPGQQLRGRAGVRGYLAPEMMTRQAKYGCEADTWSLGVVLFEMLTGTLPPPLDDSSTSPAGAGAAASHDDYHSTMELLPCYGHRVSMPAKDLIKGMLCINPRQRLPLATILQHPWLVAHQPLQQSSTEQR